MKLQIKQVGYPMSSIKTYYNITHIAVTPNLLWIEEYDGSPLYMVENIKEIKLINTLLKL